MGPPTVNTPPDFNRTTDDDHHPIHPKPPIIPPPPNFNRTTDDPEKTKLESLRRRWRDKFKDLLRPPPLRLPPWREVNHEIPLIDENKKYTSYAPKCPESLRGLLSAKIERYETAGWWRRKAVSQASPMLCIPKRPTGLRTVVDLRQRNENTVKDVTPFPDQDQIRHDLARARYRSKIDMTDAYEQVRIVERDIPKTGFSTIYGTFQSYVLQQGDCNGPSTFQRLMTVIFRTEIGLFVHVYLDDIFIFSASLSDHEKHLQIVLNRLRDASFYLSEKKFDVYSLRMDCLGCLIDEQGLHADSDKMTVVRNWRTPRNYHDVQRFLGLINYLAPWIPNLAAYTTPLSGMCAKNRPFIWRAWHQSCFDTIKALVCRAPVLKPVDFSHPDPVWIITDASAAGCGAYYGQGPTWDTIRPAGFMSRKWTNAQRNYYPFELEALAVLEAVLKWEDRLIGHRIDIGTDHAALVFFKTRRHNNHRHQRWSDYLQHFDYHIHHIAGIKNVVGDIISRYFTSDHPDEVHPIYTYSNADLRLDPEGDTLPSQRVNERTQVQLQARRISDHQEPRDHEAAELRKGALHSSATQDPPTATAIHEGPDLHNVTDTRIPDLHDSIRRGYPQDPLFSKVVPDVSAFSLFELQDGLLYYKPGVDERYLCIPRSITNGRRLTEVLIGQAHLVLGHFGSLRTANYIRRWYWWPTLQADCDRFCRSCPQCQTSKPSTQKPTGLLHSLPVPREPWESIGMDFVGPFPPSRGSDYLWVIICRLTSMVHLVPINTTTRASDLATLFIREVVRLHGLPKSIVSDRDSKFTSTFWQETHRVLGIKLLMSTSFHPQTDGASERCIRNVNQILRTLVNPDQLNWADKVPLAEFAINSSTSASSGFSPFELNYGYVPAMLDNANSTIVRGVRDFAENARSNLLAAHDAIIASRVNQTHYANRNRRRQAEFPLNGMVYLSTKNLSLPKGRARKLAPRFIGPYRIVSRNINASTYTLDLPKELRDRRIHPVFHASLLRPFTANDKALFPNRPLELYYDFGNLDDTDELVVDSISAHTWRGNKLYFTVQWADGDTTLEPFEACHELMALSEYLSQHSLGEDDWAKLPRNQRSRLKEHTGVINKTNASPRTNPPGMVNASPATPTYALAPRPGARQSARLKAATASGIGSEL